MERSSTGIEVLRGIAPCQRLHPRRSRHELEGKRQFFRIKRLGALAAVVHDLKAIAEASAIASHLLRRSPRELPRLIRKLTPAWREAPECGRYRQNAEVLRFACKYVPQVEQHLIIAESRRTREAHERGLTGEKLMA